VILAKTIDTVGRSPRIVVDGSGYRIDSGVRGISIDQSAFVKTLFDHPSETTVDVPIIVTATPLSPDGLARAQERLRKLWPVIISLQLSADERPLRLGARDFFPWLALPDGFQTDLIDQQLDKWSVAWQQPAQDAQFKWDGKSLKASEFQPEHEGRQLDQPQLKKDIQAALSRPTSETMIDIPVPFQPIAPQTKLGDLNKLGIKELIGIGHSSYMHSITNRVHNVSLTAKNINTTIVPAGAEFSFNAALGDVSKATGFLQAYVIKDNRTVLGDGGGVCQVSTTTFRAILNAGLPITAWKAHSYRVGYYEEDSKPGYDATVYAPSADLRFKNDTGHAIAIFTHTDDESRLMRVELWGTKDGRISTLSNYSITNQTPPLPTLYQDDPTLPRGTRKQVDWSAPGARTSFDYTVKNKDGSTRIQKSFVSNFQPWQAVYLVGTGN
jgi:vancomycin resistance protein YoaR